jgi:hypothetical protein
MLRPVALRFLVLVCTFKTGTVVYQSTVSPLQRGVGVRGRASCASAQQATALWLPADVSISA